MLAPASLISTALSRARLEIVFGSRRQPQPTVHRLLPTRRGRCWEIRIGKAPDSNPAVVGVAVALPEHAGTAIRAEMKTDLEAAIGRARIDLMLTFDAHLRLRP